MREFFNGWQRKLGCVTLGIGDDHLAPNDKAEHLPYALAVGFLSRTFQSFKYMHLLKQFKSLNPLDLRNARVTIRFNRIIEAITPSKGRSS